MELIKNEFQMYGDLESSAYRSVSSKVFYRIVYKLVIHIHGDYFKQFFRIR